MLQRSILRTKYKWSSLVGPILTRYVGCWFLFVHSIYTVLLTAVSWKDMYVRLRACNRISGCSLLSPDLHGLTVVCRLLVLPVQHAVGERCVLYSLLYRIRHPSWKVYQRNQLLVCCLCYCCCIRVRYEENIISRFIFFAECTLVYFRRVGHV